MGLFIMVCINVNLHLSLSKNLTVLSLEKLELRVKSAEEKTQMGEWGKELLQLPLQLLLLLLLLCTLLVQ